MMGVTSEAAASGAPPEVEQETGAGSSGEAGRPLPVIVGIVGDSGSGKTTISNGVRALIGPDQVTDVKLDDYHRYTRAERAEKGLTALNPQVHNLELVAEHLRLLRRGRPIRNRSYDHSNGTFGPMRTGEPKDVVLVRGLLGFPSDELRALYDLAVFLWPEPDLLFRWKLRRDVHSRGYTEAEVLKTIAQHLLDAKEFVLPQAERADLVVRYEIADPDAPDSEVRTTLILRRRAMEALQGALRSLERFGEQIRVEQRDGELVLELSPDLAQGEVDAWAMERFPETYVPGGQAGRYLDEHGGRSYRVQLAFIEVLIARLTQKLRRTEAPQEQPARA
jgi:uridine kinase